MSQLFSLQVGNGSEQINQVGFDIINAGEKIEKSRRHLPRLCRQMDLIISIDTRSVTAQLGWGAGPARAWGDA